MGSGAEGEIQFAFLPVLLKEMPEFQTAKGRYAPLGSTK
jgi:hypothetical protein